MRPISEELKARFESQLQTAANNADPKAEIVLSRTTVPLVDDEYLDSGAAASGSLFEGRPSLAVRRPSGQKEPDRVYVAYIDGDGTHIEYSDLPANLDDLSWTEVTHDIDAQRICIAFDGDSNLHTQADPWIFFTEDGSTLYAQKLGDAGSRTLIAEGSITAVSAIRSRAAALDGPSYGFIVFYVDAGSIYCIQRQSDGWSEPEAVELGPSGVTWTDLAAFRTRDGRVGVQAVTSTGDVYELFTTPAIGDYLLFSSASEFTLGVANATKNWDGRLEYSTDAQNWTYWDGTQAISSAGKKLMLRGTNNRVISGSGGTLGTRSFVISGQNGVRCDGNIETLLDYTTVSAGRHPAMNDYCFNALFYGCTLLTSAPDLPATSLRISSSCYASMFSGCTSLAAPPALPATTLSDNCYSHMFQGCSSLSAAPELPATTLASYCYDTMFFDCTSLITPPALPATSMKERCYDSMFGGCTSLTSAPTLPATDLSNADFCYAGMFSSCYALTAAPELPATVLSRGCYQQMFQFCRITTPPALPALNLLRQCYEQMFSGCGRLTQFPKLPGQALMGDCYKRMFDYSSLKISDHVHDEYVYPFRIPTSGTASGGGATENMFRNSSPNDVPTPAINTDYFGNYPTAE